MADKKRTTLTAKDEIKTWVDGRFLYISTPDMGTHAYEIPEEYRERFQARKNTRHQVFEMPKR